MHKKWLMCKLDEICDIFTGNSINEKEKIEKYTDISDGYNYIGTKDIGFDQCIDYENGIKIPTNDLKFKIAPKGSVLLCIEGGSAGRKIGLTDQDVCFGNKLCAFVSKIDNKYIFYFLQTSDFRNIFSYNKNGLIGGVSVNKLKNIEIPLPPLAEQGRIVAKIEELFAGIDAGVENLKSVKNQIALYRQSVLKSFLSGFATDTLANHVDMCLGKMLDKEKNKGTLFPYLRNKNVRWKNFDLDDLLEMRFEESEEERYSIQRGDLVVCEGGEPGRCAVWENDNVIKFQKALHRLRPHDNMNVYFLMYVFMLNIQAKNWDRFFTGSTIKHLTGEALKNLQIPIPTLAEQERIVAEIESRFERADALETAVDRALNDAEKLKQAVLKKAFRGELVPQNPDDEPASVLLDRIRAARASELPAKKGKRKR